VHLNVTIGVRIREAREAVVLSVEELADMVSIEAQQLIDIESGGARPSPSLLYEISELLGSPISYFF
jgi:transcriptional regulator with XRE-family HTH domain